MFIVSAGSCNQQKAITPTLKMSNSLSCQQNLLLGMKKFFFFFLQIIDLDILCSTSTVKDFTVEDGQGGANFK